MTCEIELDLNASAFLSMEGYLEGMRSQLAWWVWCTKQVLMLNILHQNNQNIQAVQNDKNSFTIYIEMGPDSSFSMIALGLLNLPAASKTM